SDGLGALGIELDCGGERTPLDLRGECVVRVELPTGVQLRWGELVLGEQRALRAPQKLVFSVDPALFDRGPAARLRLCAIDSRTRAGIPHAELAVQHYFGARRGVAGDAIGRCAADDLAAGKLALRITAPGYAPTTREVEIEPGQALDLGELALEPDTALAAVHRAPVVRCELHVLAYPTQPVLLLEGSSGTLELARWNAPTIDRRELRAGSYRVRSGERESSLEILAGPERQRIALP
ncbi:MAG: carboxypeptidase regulatory-like domain-containing protein, partial [Planctomycetes bacterium]|nr:carboxypeptidase regulatory-like domain-containing protein [Planctomycetota bacterium]